MRSMRLAVGVPAEQLAGKMGVKRREVYRLESAEESGGIVLRNLRKAAEALECDLVYGLVPREGTLEELTARFKKARDSERSERQFRRIHPYESLSGVETLCAAAWFVLQKMARTMGKKKRDALLGFKGRMQMPRRW